MPIADADKYTVELAMNGTITAGGGSSTPVTNVFHFRRTSNVNALSKTNISTAFQAAIGDILLLALNVDYTQNSNVMRFIDDADDGVTSHAQAGVGAIAGDRCQSFVAVVIRLKAVLRSRNYRGSKHYSPISESDIGDDVINAGAITRFNTLRDAMVAGFTDADANVWIPVVLSTTLSQLSVNPTTVARSDVSQCILNKTPGTMRRRKVATVT